MPLARNLTARSKSRSPIPPSDFKKSSSPRPFLPPSHYAAAAGIQYKPSAHNDDSDSNDFDNIDTNQNRIDVKESYQSAFMPISYPSESDTASESSFEFKPASRFSSEPGGERQPLTPKSSLRGNHQNHITGLPQLEAHLLPSLRDTIDRMTRSPSRVESPSSQRGESHLRIPTPLKNPRPSRPSSPSRSYCKDLSVIANNSPQIYRTTSTPERSFSKVHSKSTITAEVHKPQIPAKPPPKSSLRPPTPKLFSGTASPVEPVPPVSPGGALKSVRSILRRKASTASLAASPAPESNTISKKLKPGVTQTFKYMRGRSRPDPGIPSPLEPFLPSSERKSAVGTLEGSFTDTDAHGSKNVNTLSISRPQRKSHRNSLLPTAPPDDSDMEYRCEIEERARRKLIVANAEVVLSSSDSELGSKDGHSIRSDTGKERLGSPNDTHADARIGLGLTFQPGTRRNQGDQRRIIDHHTRDTPRRSASRPRRSETVPPWSPLSSDLHSARPSSPFRYPTDSPQSDQDAAHQRRRAALLGVISGIDLGASSQFGGEGEESDYCGESGLAISGSGGLASKLAPSARSHIVAPIINMDEGPNQEDTQWERRHKTLRPERPRSSSCMPTFLFSAADDHGRDHGESSTVRRTSQARKYTESRTPSPHTGSGRKSLSRSPVIPQTDLPTLPAALRRHSVYHRSISGPTAAKADEERSLTTKYGSVSKYRESLQQNRGNKSDGPAVVCQGPYAAAARERKAYGIPNSDSVEVYRGMDQRRGSQALTHADSDLSSVGSVYWNDDEGDSELSAGAETLFRKLNGGQSKEAEWKTHSVSDRMSRASLVPRPLSPSSAYEDQQTEVNWHDGYNPPPYPIRGEHQEKSSPSPIHEKDLLDQRGNLETTRQDFIAELCQSEKDFVGRMEVFVRLFVLPLRVQDSKTWITGVPPEAARFFDWFEDIMVLHRQIVSSLESTCMAQYPIVERVAQSIRTFIPRFEVYQPYLVKLEDAMDLISQAVQDENSDFGEFVDIQERAPECDGWTVERFLVEPIKRLSNFPQTFTRLLELTPKSHPDYLSTFSLVHCTNMVIRVLTEVKAREDEYDLVKRFSARITGLSPSTQLAARERRLIQQGILHLIDADDNMGTAHLPSTPGMSKISQYFPTGSKPTRNDALNRTSKLAIAIHQWDARRRRSASTSSSSTGMSSSSFGTVSSGASSGAPSTPCSTFFSSFRIPMPDGRLSKVCGPMPVKPPASPSPAPRRHVSSRGAPVQVFVFTDLVLLATPSTETDEWTLLRHIGTLRILGVSDPGTEPHDPDILVLEALPIDPAMLNEPTSMDHGSVVVLRFSVSPTDDLQAAPSDQDTTTPPWISAFNQCARFTLCSISTHSRNHDLGTNVALDTQHTVFSLLAAGLPLPKSPSVQIADLHLQEGEADVRREEREARGWWSVRFQQVFRELQRLDVARSGF